MADGTAESKYITLVSSDGLEFVVLREATSISPVIKSMVDPASQFLEAQTGRCVFPDIRYVDRVVLHPSQCAPIALHYLQFMMKHKLSIGLLTDHP